jgi:hypothetical protein
MKHVLFSIFSFLFAATVFSQKIDTLTSYQWQNNAWQPEIRSISTYNSECLDTSVLTQTWQIGSASWADTSLTTNTYNANNQISQSTTQFWNSNTNSWDNALRQTNSYNSNSLVDSVLEEIWQANNWQNFGLITNTYNADGKLSKSLFQFWVVTIWTNSSRTTYTYNTDKTIHQTVQQTWNGSAWVNQSRSTFTYNAMGRIVTDTIQTRANNKWVNEELTIYTYDGNNYLVNSLSQQWNNLSSVWENDTQENYTNNSDGTPAEVIAQDWNNSTSVWENVSRTTFSYSASCTLPLTLLDFTAILNGKAVQLQWTTVTEINTKNFVVQRSIDGINFNSIGTVDAAGNSTQKKSYQFVDVAAFNAGANKIYYHLQMVDKDGKYAYSKIAVVNITPGGKLFVIYPNPVKDQLIVTTNSLLNKTEMRITDQNGKLVYKQQLENIQAGMQNKLNVANLQKGIYYLQIITGSDVQTTKIFKY